MASRMAPQESEWRRKTEEAESKSASNALFDEMLHSHNKLEKQPIEEESLPGGGNAMRKAFIRKRMGAIEQAMMGEG